MQQEEFGYEAKFAVRTDFLDTTFRRNRQQREGESYEEFVSETHKMFLGLVESMKKDLQIDVGWGKGVYAPPAAPSPMPIIDRSSVEKLEILIDNAPTVSDLAQFKEEASKHGLVGQYMERLRQLTTIE